MQRNGFCAEIDQATETGWSTAVDLFSDANIHQTWHYGSISWGTEGLSHAILKRGCQIVGMAQLRVVRPRWLSCGFAYLRWGPLCHLKGNELDSNVTREMAEVLYEEYVQKRGLFLRIFPNAFRDTPRALAFQTAFSVFAAEAFRAGQPHRTLVLDLSPSLDELRRSFDQKWRNQLNRAEKNGLTVTESESAEDFAAFLEMYDQMVARKRFETSTNVHRFADMQRDLPKGQRMKIFLCHHRGAPVAGLVGSAMGDSGIYLHGATSDEGLQLKGAYLLQWTMISWLKQCGVRYYNLGGINPQTNPGVYHFKKGLSGRDVHYLSPFVACRNPLSSLFARAADSSLRRHLIFWSHIMLRGRSGLKVPEPTVKCEDLA